MCCETDVARSDDLLLRQIKLLILHISNRKSVFEQHRITR